jgi:hypothetical protein
VLEAREDELSSSLRRWFLRVRSLVLLPSQESLAQAALPTFGMLLSPPMADVIKDAQSLGISDLPDVHTMTNCFKCLSWSLSTLEVICRKPSISEISALVAMVSGFKLPDEKAFKTMKFMLSKATQVQLKIVKAVAPSAKPGETKPINVPLLMELDASSDELPLIIPEKRILRAAIDNSGQSCCRGPSAKLQESPSSDRDVSPHAPDPVKLWPPFGILGSDAALEVLGKECSAIPDETCKLEILCHTPSESQCDDKVVTPSLLPATQIIKTESPGMVISTQPSYSRSPNQILIEKSAEQSPSGAELSVVDDMNEISVGRERSAAGTLPGCGSLDTDSQTAVAMSSWKTPPETVMAPPRHGSREGETSNRQLTSLKSSLEVATSDPHNRGFIHGLVDALPKESEQGMMYRQAVDFPKLTHVPNGIAVEDRNT